MADEGNLLIETDFLFGIRENDELNPLVEKALNQHREGKLDLTVSGAAPIEAHAVMDSQGVDQSTISKALSLMESRLVQEKIDEYTDITLTDMSAATRLRNEIGELTFFDSIHAAISTRTQTPILSSDPIFRETRATWVNLTEI